MRRGKGGARGSLLMPVIPLGLRPPSPTTSRQVHAAFLASNNPPPTAASSSSSSSSAPQHSRVVFAAARATVDAQAERRAKADAEQRALDELRARQDFVCFILACELVSQTKHQLITHMFVAVFICVHYVICCVAPFDLYFLAY